MKKKFLMEKSFIIHDWTRISILELIGDDFNFIIKNNFDINGHILYWVTALYSKWMFVEMNINRLLHFPLIFLHATPPISPLTPTQIHDLFNFNI